MASRETSLVVTFILLVASISAEETPTSSGDCNSSSGGRNCELAATQCPEKCEIKFPGRTCKVNLNCLMEILYSPRDLALENLPEGGGDGGDDQCGGRCRFQDKQGNCRLDLICVLDGNSAGTCQFLGDCDIPSFFEESSDERGHCSSSNTERDCTDTGAREGGSTDDDGAGILSITDPPERKCPGKCMVRNRQGDCVVDYNCANMDP